MSFDPAVIKRLLMRPDVDSTLTQHTPDVQMQLIQSLAATYQLLDQHVIKRSLLFVEENHLWNEYGVYGTRRDTWRNRWNGHRFMKGRVLQINFGSHNIGTEFSFPHMGIVIADYEEVVTVVPITSDKGQRYKKETNKGVIRLKAAESDSDFPARDVILLMYQMRTISKNRILKDTRQSIQGTSLMQQLEQKIAERFARGYLNLLQDEIRELHLKNRQLEEAASVFQEVAVENDNRD